MNERKYLRNVVYLKECDSVRKSREEIHIGQWAICNALVQQGYVVVFSLNQVTDSHIMFELLTDKRSKKYIMELFQTGWLKIGLYGSNYSLSDYILNSINKNFNNESKFIFSLLPVKTDEKLLLKLVERAFSSGNANMFSEEKNYYFLRNICNDLLEKVNGSNKKLEKNEFSSDDIENFLKSINKKNDAVIRRLNNIHKYVCAMISLNAIGPSLYYKKEPTSCQFNEIINHLCDWKIGETDLKKYFGNNKEIYENALEILKNLREQYATQKPSKLKIIFQILLSKLWPFKRKNKTRSDKLKLKDKTDRSIWLDKLRKTESVAENREYFQMANAIIDMAYNYTVEDSVENAVKQYETIKDKNNILSESFKKDFLKELKTYWTIHYKYLVVPEQDTTKINLLKRKRISLKFYDQLPNWRRVARFLKNKKPILNEEKVNFQKNDKDYRKRWQWECISDILESLKIYARIAVCIWALDLMGESLSDILSNFILQFSWISNISNGLPVMLKDFLNVLFVEGLFILTTTSFILSLIESRLGQKIDVVEFWKDFIWNIIGWPVLHIYYRVYWWMLKRLISNKVRREFESEKE